MTQSRKKRRLQAGAEHLARVEQDLERPEVVEAIAGAMLAAEREREAAERAAEAAAQEAAEAEALIAATQESEDAIDNAFELKRTVESLLFASDRPLTMTDFKQYLGGNIVRAEVQTCLDALVEDYKDRGIVLHDVAGGYQFRTHSASSQWIQKLIAGRPVRLSRAQLDTLAIVAYRQPITRPEIDEIRGVDSGSTLKILLDRNLIRIMGKREEVGRPMLYGTTKDFLEFFNLSELRDLPTLREFHELNDEGMAEVDKLGADIEGVDVGQVAAEVAREREEAEALAIAAAEELANEKKAAREAAKAEKRAAAQALAEGEDAGLDAAELEDALLEDVDALDAAAIEDVPLEEEEARAAESEDAPAADQDDDHEAVADAGDDASAINAVAQDDDPAAQPSSESVSADLLFAMDDEAPVYSLDALDDDADEGQEWTDADDQRAQGPEDSFEEASENTSDESYSAQGAEPVSDESDGQEEAVMMQGDDTSGTEGEEEATRVDTEPESSADMAIADEGNTRDTAVDNPIVDSTLVDRMAVPESVTDLGDSTDRIYEGEELGDDTVVGTSYETETPADAFVPEHSVERGNTSSSETSE